MADDEWDDWDDDETAVPQIVPVNNAVTTTIHKAEYVTSSEDDERIERVVTSLRDYMNDLADSNVRDEINVSLNRITYQRFINYYLLHPNLSDYMISEELHRMDFTVIHDCTQYQDRESIAAIYDKTPLLDIWRLGNQSIFAEILLHLQSSYFKPELSISIASSSCSILIDTDHMKYNATTELVFTTVTDSRVSRKSRLDLASISATVDIDMGAKTLQQRIGTPVLRVVFDTDFRITARVLLELRDSDEELPDVGSLSIAAMREQLLETTEKVIGLRDNVVKQVVSSVGRIVGLQAGASGSRRVEESASPLRFYSKEVDNNRAQGLPEAEPEAGIFDSWVSSFGQLFGAKGRAASDEQEGISLYRKE